MAMHVTRHSVPDNYITTVSTMSHTYAEDGIYEVRFTGCCRPTLKSVIAPGPGVLENNGQVRQPPPLLLVVVGVRVWG